MCCCCDLCFSGCLCWEYSVGCGCWVYFFGSFGSGQCGCCLCYHLSVGSALHLFYSSRLHFLRGLFFVHFGLGVHLGVIRSFGVLFEFCFLSFVQ